MKKRIYQHQRCPWHGSGNLFILPSRRGSGWISRKFSFIFIEKTYSKDKIYFYMNSFFNKSKFQMKTFYREHSYREYNEFLTLSTTSDVIIFLYWSGIKRMICRSWPLFREYLNNGCIWEIFIELCREIEERLRCVM